MRAEGERGGRGGREGREGREGGREGERRGEGREEARRHGSKSVYNYCVVCIIIVLCVCVCVCVCVHVGVHMCVTVPAASVSPAQLTPPPLNHWRQLCTHKASQQTYPCTDFGNQSKNREIGAIIYDALCIILCILVRITHADYTEKRLSL